MGLIVRGAGRTEAIVERGWYFMSYGIYNTRYLNTDSEEPER